MPMCVRFLILLPLFWSSPAPAAAERISFNHQIRPLLSDRCFTCHGPDEQARKGNLRLDTEEGSRKRLDDGGQVVSPGAPDRSEVVRRIFSSDPDEQMPPPKAHLGLSAGEKELIKRWIAEGADYQGHWSFLPVQPALLPRAVDVGGRAGNEIDLFVRARLAREGLQPAPPADRATLIRRLSFDLNGLPPTPEEIRGFADDPSPVAYERLVERLLASARYGEQLAVDWLDLARYADTYGYQADVERDLSPWRDWVVKAFNQNLPYDQFITWQIAGDLLPEATGEQRLATAFNRLHRQTNEGGSIDEEFRVEYVSDRVHTFGTAMLGLTLECARCHDHKYDPIKQRDYYALSAFFNNIDESGLYSHFTRATPNPTMLLYPDAGQEQAHTRLKRRIAELEAPAGPPDDRGSAKLSGERKAAKLVPPVAAFAFDALEGNRSPNAISTNSAEFVDGPKLVEGKLGQAVQFSGDNQVICKNTGQFSRTNEFTIAFWLKRTEEQERAIVLHCSRAWSDSGSRGYELVLEQGRPTFALIHFWPGNAIAIRAREALPLNEWVQLTLTYDGSSRATGLGLFVNGKPTAVETVRDHLFKDIQHRAAWGDADVGNIQLTLGGRFRDSGFRNGLIDDLRVYDRDLAAVAGERQTAAELKELRARENDLVNDVPELMVMEELAQRRPTYVLKRGAYDARGDEVQPGTPAGILPFDPAWPRNRLGLARWLTDRRNPLTARVAVNRAWRQHFGRGLVATDEDFGSQGRWPSHPELLDWLAGWFMDHQWDLKSLHQLIVMSATYQQSSRASAELLARDPTNDLLARGPKHRLSAEQLRDQALVVSGLLTPDIGGPSAKPYQPAGLWEEAGTGKSYTPDKGARLYRRSLYTFWRRTAPPPSMMTFDATSREVCTAKREPTATPLQSLVLLNDPQFIEAARVLAARLWRDSAGDVAKCIESGFLALAGRSVDAAERAMLLKLFARQRERFAVQAEAARQIIKIGEQPADANQPPVDLAALTLVFNTVMNYDEFVTKR